MTNVVRAGHVIERMPPAVHAFSTVALANLSNTTPQPGDPVVEVSFVAPPSGRVLAVVGGGLRDSSGTNRVFIAPEIREDDVSGTIVQAAQISINGWSSASTTGTSHYGSRLTVAPLDMDGLTTALEPGRTYHARVLHAVSGGSTSGVQSRDLTVCPLPLSGVYDGYGDGLTRAGDRPLVAHAYSGTTQLNIQAAVGARLQGDPVVDTTFVAPASGRALVVTSAGIRDNSSTGRAIVIPEIRVGGPDGPLLIDPEDTIDGTQNAFRFAITNSGNQTVNYQYVSRAGFLGPPSTPPLIPGRQYHVQLFMFTSGGGTTDVFNREVEVIPLS